MYESQVRPAIHGRKLVAQQTSCPHSSFHDKFRAALPESPRSTSLNRFPLSLFAFICILAGVCFVTGCGSLNYKSVGPASSQALSAVSCGTQSLTGPQSKTCSVAISAPALALITVNLSSDNAALKVPAQVQITVGQTSATFNAVTTGVQKKATATITAKSHGVVKTAAIALYPANATLAAISCPTQTLVGPTSSTCSVQLGSPASTAMAVALTSSSPAIQVPASVTIDSGSASAQFAATVSAVPSSQNVTLTASAGGSTQTFSINLQSASTTAAVQHRVQLSWVAPSSSGPSIVGYNVYRAVTNVSSFALLVPSDPQTSYIDASVQSGTTYDYVVKSVDVNGTESAPSDPTRVTIP